MIAEVEGERGALPMLAFAMARLWDKRDRARHVLTRQAHDDIGGVSGALARHAEATIDHIGADRLVIVRELFRNLVTAEGARAVREWDELLSIFSGSRSESPTAILRALIDARLLTSYEILEEEQVPTRRVEIVHESLLENWPRLVGWQTQDADSAGMRDELRQAARTWDEHGRHPDRLWTGSAYRAFTAWRERYPGALSDIEESYAWAMTTYAKRRRRLRRIAVAVFMVVAAAVAARDHGSVAPECLPRAPGRSAKANRPRAGPAGRVSALPPLPTRRAASISLTARKRDTWPLKPFGRGPPHLSSTNTRRCMPPLAGMGNGLCNHMISPAPWQ